MKNPDEVWKWFFEEGKKRIFYDLLYEFYIMAYHDGWTERGESYESETDED